MVALHNKDAATLRLTGRLQNHEVGDIAEGKDEISGLGGEVVANRIIIGEHEKFHFTTQTPANCSNRVSKSFARAIALRHGTGTIASP